MDPGASILVLVLSATPGFEARYAIPLAINTLGFSPAEAFALGLIGNTIPVVALLLLLEPVSEYLSRHIPFFERFFTWLFERTRRHSDRFERWGALALIPFVAFVFGIRFWYALPTIFAGMVIAALATTIGVTTLQLLIP